MRYAAAKGILKYLVISVWALSVICTHCVELSKLAWIDIYIISMCPGSKKKINLGLKAIIGFFKAQEPSKPVALPLKI